VYEKILIVEDEKIIALDLQRRLEKYGYIVIGVVATGGEAIEKAERLLPDVVLMDIMLAGDIDGIDAARIINQRLQLPIIFITAYADQKILERAKEAEPFGYIVKPFKEKEIHSTIDIALYKHSIDKKLKTQERWFSAILHSIEDGIIATDRENKIQFMNPVGAKIIGLREDQIKGQPLENVLTLIDENYLKPFILPFIINKTQNSSGIFKNVLVKKPDGEEVPVEGSYSQIRNRDNKVEGYVIVLRDISERRKMSEKLNYQISHDALTGLLNRAQFSESLLYFIKTARTENRQHAFLLIDIDQFRLINDTCGHAAGDELLLEATSIIKTVLRGSDICARMGGDEFGILLRDSNREQALHIATRLHSKLSERKLEWEGKTFNIHSSVGLVMIDSETKDIQNILAAADDAWHLAKEEGGRRIKVYETSNSLFLQRKGERQWITQLTRALEEERFQLYFQSIIPLSENNVGREEKCEILLRMIDEKGEIISPADFIPAAERYNLMPSIDRWVVRTAMMMYQKIKDRQGENNPEMMFTVNLSAESVTDEHFLDYIYTQLESYDIEPERFCFEITETAAISNMIKASKFIHELKEIGCTFALDDFGSGFSSFSYLKNIPVDFLKIDGSFVQDMHINSLNSAMVEAINNLGHIIGIKTIAEFVNNASIIEKLIELGVDYAQGFEIAKPQPLKNLLLSEGKAY